MRSAARGSAEREGKKQRGRERERLLKGISSDGQSKVQVSQSWHIPVSVCIKRCAQGWSSTVESM